MDKSDPDHPVFSFKDFPEREFVLKVLSENKDPKLPIPPEPFLKLFFDSSNVKILNQIYQEKNLDTQFYCGRIIPEGHAVYFCIDCDATQKSQTDARPIMCQECFFNSNHINHRSMLLYTASEDSEVCACGDPDAIPPEGF